MLLTPHTGTHTHTLTTGNKQSVPLSNTTHVALWNLISKKDFTLIGRQDPLLIADQVLLSRGNQIEDLLTLSMQLNIVYQSHTFSAGYTEYSTALQQLAHTIMVWRKAKYISEHLFLPHDLLIMNFPVDVTVI